MTGPGPVERAARDGRLVAFVGAGVSVAPPTCLPSWWEVNQAVVEALARRVAPEVGDEAARGYARMVSERQRADRFPPEYQAEIIVGRVRHRYFEVLRCLDGDEPNASHLALAGLARAGRIRAIVTTNFDRVLEAALRTADVPFAVRFRPEHFQELADDPAVLDRTGAPCQLLKIHGSADAPDTLVDTLSQRKRGLPQATNACIRRLLRFGHWLFAGFSGADLEADPEYLHLRGDRAVARGFTWLVREGHEPLGAVRRVAELYGERAGIVHGELPDWLDDLARRLGADAPAPLALSEEQVAQRRAAASRDVLEHTDTWAAGLGTRRCAVVLAALLDGVGEPGAALALLERIRERTTDEDRRTGTYALVCAELASLHRDRGENGRALERFDEAAAIFDGLGAAEQAIGVRSNMALALVDLGRYDEALPHFEVARESAAARGDRAGQAVALHNIALIHRSRGEFVQAVRLFEEELSHVVALGDERARATVLLSIGDALVRLDRYDDALRSLHASLDIVERLGDEAGRARALGNIANVHQIRADYDEAVRVYDEARAIFEELGDVAGMATTLLNLASIAQASGALDDALALALDAAARAGAAGLEPLRARGLHTAGALHRERGEPGRAAACLDEALALRTAAADLQGRADTLNQIGILRREQEDPAAAWEALQEALRIRTELGEERARAETLNNLAMLALDRGDPEQAVRLLRDAMDVHERLGIEAAAAPTAFNLGNANLKLGELDAAAHWFDVALDHVLMAGHAGRATDARLAIAWTRGLQGRVQEAMHAFADAEAHAPTPAALLQVAARMHALADVYRANRYDDVALTIAAEARRVAETAGA